MGDLRSQLLASIDEIKSKITVAHGALYEYNAELKPSGYANLMR